jgi:hypothetical protein
MVVTPFGVSSTGGVKCWNNGCYGHVQQNYSSASARSVSDRREWIKPSGARAPTLVQHLNVKWFVEVKGNNHLVMDTIWDCRFPLMLDLWSSLSFVGEVCEKEVSHKKWPGL